MSLTLLTDHDQDHETSTVHTVTGDSLGLFVARPTQSEYYPRHLEEKHLEEKSKVIAVGTHRVVGNNPVDTATDDKKVVFFKRWIPMKNMKIRYQGAGILDCRYEFALFFVAYRDGTITSQLGNVNGSMAMYFKDP